MNCVSTILSNKGSTVWTIHENETVYKGLEVMAEKDIGALVVLDSLDRPVGIFSERDYARKVRLKGKSSLSTSVKELMVTDLHIVKIDDSIEHCMTLMTENKTRYLVVMELDKLAGLISTGDVVNQLLSHQKFQIKELTSYITGAPGKGQG
ncbi:MAG: CBS domain-containing protein [Candidatus Dadabacteria bacterium]|nr:CBS domain-containing protein [Candidatus Dadabacteria bacterium]